MVTPAALAFFDDLLRGQLGRLVQDEGEPLGRDLFVGRVVGHEIAHPLCGERILRVEPPERREFYRKAGRREGFDIVQRWRVTGRREDEVGGDSPSTAPTPPSERYQKPSRLPAFL